jgi:hypothetical protein
MRGIVISTLFAPRGKCQFPAAAPTIHLINLMQTPNPHFQAFLHHANAARYRDALLALEEVWKVEREEFYAGVLQLLVSLNQLHSGLKPRRTLSRARERIAPYAPSFAGLDVPYLLSVIEACEAILPDDDALPLQGQIPALHLTLTT